MIAETTMVWAVPRSIATTWGITVVFFSSAYLDVSVQRVRPPTEAGVPHLRAAGCPIRTPADQWSFAPPRGFSQLIASFIASQSLGILRAPLSTFSRRAPNNAPRGTSKGETVPFWRFYQNSRFFQHVNEHEPRKTGHLVVRKGIGPLHTAARPNVGRNQQSPQTKQGRKRAP